jgi:hypothetical protein
MFFIRTVQQDKEEKKAGQCTMFQENGEVFLLFGK